VGCLPSAWITLRIHDRAAVSTSRRLRADVPRCQGAVRHIGGRDVCRRLTLGFDEWLAAVGGGVRSAVRQIRKAASGHPGRPSSHRNNSNSALAPNAREHCLQHLAIPVHRGLNGEDMSVRFAGAQRALARLPGDCWFHDGRHHERLRMKCQASRVVAASPIVKARVDGFQ